jgi:DNA-binding NarL/FixJ family response regulator
LTAPVVARVVILAEDLIWSDRLSASVRAASADPIVIRTIERLTTELPTADAAIVDLTARAYDGIDAVGRVADAGVPVLAVGQHDDQALRRAARAAGAERVLAYRKLAEDGPAAITAFLARQAGAPS